MLARFERYLYALIAMLALWAVVVAVTPATAQAQEETAPTKDTTKDTKGNISESIVVSPGDSLWSITSERLGPRATPRQIAIGVERIYTLNQNQIGGDPDLIFVGQKLSLPPMDEEPSRRARGAAKAAAKAAEASTRDLDPEGASKAQPNTATKPVALPEVLRRQPVPKVGAPSATEGFSPVESFVRTARSLLSSATSAIVGLFPQADRLEERKLLGLGIIALTLIVAGFIAWKMPLKRNVGGYEVWGIPTGYASDYTYPAKAAEPHSGSHGGDEAPAVVENGLNGSAAMMIVAARRTRSHLRREQERGNGHSPHRGLATGAHNPRITRQIRRARTSTPKRGRR